MIDLALKLGIPNLRNVQIKDPKTGRMTTLSKLFDKKYGPIFADLDKVSERVQKSTDVHEILQILKLFNGCNTKENAAARDFRWLCSWRAGVLIRQAKMSEDEI